MERSLEKSDVYGRPDILHYITRTCEGEVSNLDLDKPLIYLRQFNVELRELPLRIGKCSKVCRCIEQSKSQPSRCHPQQLHRSVMTKTEGTCKDQHQQSDVHRRREATSSLHWRRHLSHKIYGISSNPQKLLYIDFWNISELNKSRMQHFVLFFLNFWNLWPLLDFSDQKTSEIVKRFWFFSAAIPVRFLKIFQSFQIKSNQSASTAITKLILCKNNAIHIWSLHSFQKILSSRENAWPPTPRRTVESAVLDSCATVENEIQRWLSLN